MSADSLWMNSACSSCQDLIFPLKGSVNTRDGVTALLQLFQSQAGNGTGDHISLPHLPDRQHDFLHSIPAQGTRLGSTEKASLVLLKGLKVGLQTQEKGNNLWLGLFAARFLRPVPSLLSSFNCFHKEPGPLSPIDPRRILAEPACVSQQSCWVQHKGTQLAPEACQQDAVPALAHSLLHWTQANLAVTTRCSSGIWVLQAPAAWIQHGSAEPPSPCLGGQGQLWLHQC